MELLDKIEEYWTGRAEGYSQVNQGELATEQREKWKKNLMSHLKGKKPEETKVLDIGTGPGFFAIILAEAGYQVTAVDYTEEMLKEAGKTINGQTVVISGAGKSLWRVDQSSEKRRHPFKL